MDFKEYIKSKTTEKYLSLLSGKTESPTKDINLVSIDKYLCSNKEFNERLNNEPQEMLKAQKIAIANKNKRLAAEKAEQDRIAAEKARIEAEEFLNAQTEVFNTTVFNSLVQIQGFEKAYNNAKANLDPFVADFVTDAELLNAIAKEKAKQKRAEARKPINRIKRALKLALAVLIIIGLISVVKLIKGVNPSSVKSFEMTAVELLNEEYIGLRVEVKNNTKATLRELQGIIHITNSDKQELINATINFRGDIVARKSAELDVEFNSYQRDDLEQLYFADLTCVEITFEPIGAVFDNQSYEYKSKEININPEYKRNKITQSEKYKALEKQYEAVMQEYEKVDIESENFEFEVTQVFCKLDEIWDDLSISSALQDKMFDEAVKYEKDKEYKKAYLLFEMLSKIDYPAADTHAYNCYRFSYDSQSYNY